MGWPQCCRQTKQRAMRELRCCSITGRTPIVRSPRITVVRSSQDCFVAKLMASTEIKIRLRLLEHAKIARKK